MAKLDWQKLDDYEYTERLDRYGWAWEFIRRGSSYRESYTKTSALIEQKYAGDWSKQPKFYVPEKAEGENENAWKLRLSENGITGRQLLGSQKIARQWSLWDMYDPKNIYNSQTIHFDLYNPYPAFYGSIVEEDAFGTTPISSLILNQVRPLEEISQPLGPKIDCGTIFIAVDVRIPIPKQLDQAASF